MTTHLRLALFLALIVTLLTSTALAQPAERLYVALSPEDTPGASAVVVFDVAADGTLTQQAAGPYPTGGSGSAQTAPEAVAVDADGRFLFVANNESATLSSFVISPADGGLSLVPSSPVALASPVISLAPHPTLPVLYVPEFFDQLRVFGVQPDGSLQLLQSLAPPLALCSVTVHPSGGFVYAISGCFGGSTIRIYAVAPDGTLSETAGSPVPVADSRLFYVAAAPDGSSLYALDLDLGVFAFAVETSNGDLTPVAGSPFAAGAFMEQLALTPDDRFVYLTEPFANAILGFARQADASLLPVPGSPYTGDYIAAALLASSRSARLLLVGRETRRISTYDIDGDGRLLPLGPPVDVADALGRVPTGAALLDLAREIEVSLDVKPGSDPNAINPRARGVIPVAILGADDFDVTVVDVSSLRFGPAGAAPLHGGHLEEVDGDGLLDLVLHFAVAETGIACGDVSASLTGSTTDGRALRGADSIVTRGCD